MSWANRTTSMRANTIRTPAGSRGDAHPTCGTSDPTGLQGLLRRSPASPRYTCGYCPRLARRSLRQGAHRVVGATSKVSARRAPPGGASSGWWCFAGGVRGGPDVCAGGVADRTVRTHVKGRREPSGAVLEACGASLRLRAEQVGVLAVQRGSAPGVRTALRAGDVLSSKTAAS